MVVQFSQAFGEEAPILIPAIGLELLVRIPPIVTAGDITVIETTNAPGFGPPLHRHPEAELFRVLEGEYLYEVDGRRFVAKAGDVVTIPGHSVHAFVNVTEKPARQLIMIMPGLDAAAFFNGLAEVMRGGRPDAEKLNQFGLEWNVEFLGPPLKVAEP